MLKESSLQNQGKKNQSSSWERLGFTHLPWLMLTLLTLSACMAVFVSVSITWSLWSTTSPWEGKETMVCDHGFTVSVHQNDYAIINRDRTVSISQHGKTLLQVDQACWRSLGPQLWVTLHLWQFIYRVSVMGERDSTNPVGERATGEPHLWARVNTSEMLLRAGTK